MFNDKRQTCKWIKNADSTISTRVSYMCIRHELQVCLQPNQFSAYIKKWLEEKDTKKKERKKQNFNVVEIKT